MSLVHQTTIETASATDVGIVRTLNEDSTAVASSDEPGKKEKGTVLVLADGLGGCNAGEFASTLVTKKLPELYFGGSSNDYVSDLLNAVVRSNKMVHEASMTSADLSGMGTTLVAAVIVHEYVIFVNVGDSRGYLFREESIIHRTKDHSLKDASLDVPGFSPANRFSHVLTRAIGPKPTVLIDVTIHEILPGDSVLLCSDGLTDYVADDEIKEILFNRSPDEATQMLVDTANARGGEDNISVIIAKVNRISNSYPLDPCLSGVRRYLVF